MGETTVSIDVRGRASFGHLADILNSWSNNISELLSKVEKTCHLIHKESMVHGSAAK